MHYTRTDARIQKYPYMNNLRPHILAYTHTHAHQNQHIHTHTNTHIHTHTNGLEKYVQINNSYKMLKC